MTELQTFDLPAFKDDRGSFVKIFNRKSIEALGIEFMIEESYYSISSKNVIRGMHFQLPPYDHSKIVCCISGAILDVAIDLRKLSPTFGQCFSQLLTSDNNKAFYIPKGFAHGFKALSEGAITYYLVSGLYNSDNDTGIAYNSINFDWECETPILSDRDKGFVGIKDFRTPF